MDNRRNITFNEFCDCLRFSFINTSDINKFQEFIRNSSVFRDNDKCSLTNLENFAKKLLNIGEDEIITQKKALRYHIGKDILSIIGNFKNYEKIVKKYNLHEILEHIKLRLGTELDMYFVEKLPIMPFKNFTAVDLGKYWQKYGIKPGIYINKRRVKEQPLYLSWILFHEAIHHNLNKKYKPIIPGWFCHYFEEGFADFFASYEFAEIFSKNLIKNYLYNKVNWVGRHDKDDIYYDVYFKLCVLLYLEGGDVWYEKILNNLRILRQSDRDWFKENISLVWGRGKYYDLFRDILTWNRIMEDPLILYLYEKYGKEMRSGISINKFCKEYRVCKEDLLRACKNSGLILLNEDIVVLRYLSQEELNIIKYRIM